MHWQTDSCTPQHEMLHPLPACITKCQLRLDSNKQHSCRDANRHSSTGCTWVVISSLALVTASSSVFRCWRVLTAWVATSRHSGLDTSLDTRVTRGRMLGRKTAAWAGCSTSCRRTLGCE